MRARGWSDAPARTWNTGMTLTESGAGGTPSACSQGPGQPRIPRELSWQSSTVPAAVGTVLWYDGGPACVGSLPTGSGKTLLVRMMICHLLTDHDELLIAVVCENSNTEGRCTCLLCQVAPSPSCLATSSIPHASSSIWATVTPMCWWNTGDCYVRRSRR